MQPHNHTEPVSLLQAALFGALVGGGLSLVSLWSEGATGDAMEITGRATGGAIGFALMFVAAAFFLNRRRSRR